MVTTAVDTMPTSRKEDMFLSTFHKIFFDKITNIAITDVMENLI